VIRKNIAHSEVKKGGRVEGEAETGNVSAPLSNSMAISGNQRK
jgi:hypothetical protein